MQKLYIKIKDKHTQKPLLEKAILGTPDYIAKEYHKIYMLLKRTYAKKNLAKIDLHKKIFKDGCYQLYNAGLSKEMVCVPKVDVFSYWFLGKI